MTDEQKQKYIEAQKHRYYNMTDEQKKYKEAQKHKYHNMTDEQKQKRKRLSKII